MKTFGHASGGWIISRLMLPILKIPEQDKCNLLCLGTLASVAPDLDFIFYIFKKGKFDYGTDFQHHKWVTHTFPLYWLFSALIFIAGATKADQKIMNEALVIAAGSSIHLLQDMIGSGDGIMALYPFSKKMFGVGLLNAHGREWEKLYTKSKYYKVEKLITIIAVIDLLHYLIKRA